MTDDWFDSLDQQQAKAILDRLLQPARTIIEKVVVPHGAQPRIIDGTHDRTEINKDGGIETEVTRIQAVDDHGAPISVATFGGITADGEICSTATIGRCVSCHASISIRNAVVIPPGEFEKGKWLCRRCARRIRNRMMIRATLMGLFHQFLEKGADDAPDPPTNTR